MPFTPRLILVTASSLDEARRLAQGLLEQHLAACINLVPGIESHYWWEGKLESGTEVLLLIKSSAEQFEALSNFIRTHHSYACPEIVTLEPGAIAPSYFEWWKNEVASTGIA